MISRRAILGGAVAALLAAPRWACAQGRSGSPSLVGTLTGDPSAPTHKAFLEALRGLGYAEGQTIRVEARFHHGKSERCPALAAELVALKPAVILGTSPYGISALKAATSTIPIVGHDLESDPVAAGFVGSLARPGGNITGIFLDMPELAGKLLQFLKESLPRLARVGVLWDANIAKLQFQAVEQAAATARVRIHSLPIRNIEGIAPAVAGAARERVGALLVLSSPFTFIYRVELAELLLKHRLPSISLFTPFAEAGGLLAYGPDFIGMFRQSAGFVDRVLKGARPAEMPVERPVKFELIVNLKTAKALKLTIPPIVLGRADRTIE
jgi:putative ABC transport system substrate-binding protein